MNTIATLKGHRMFENDSFLLLWSKGPLGISYPLFTSFHVFIKHSETAVKATGREKRFLLACISEWQRSGKELKELREKDFLGHFCEAVASRYGIRWKMFFQTQTPQEVVAALRENI